MVAALFESHDFYVSLHTFDDLLFMSDAMLSPLASYHDERSLVLSGVLKHFCSGAVVKLIYLSVISCAPVFFSSVRQAAEPLT